MDDIILTGRNPKADAKLIADVLNAPTQQELVECDDPFDGGCPADIMPRRRDDITGRPRVRKPDLRNIAVAEAYADGLAAWAMSNGFMCPDGTPMVYSARLRRLVERARARAQKSVS